MYDKNNERNHYRFHVENEGGRIDTFLKEQGFSSRLISSVKRAGLLTLNDRPVRFVDDAKEGDTIDVYLPEERIDCEPSDDGTELDIIYEDDEILVVNKPPFVVTHPTQQYTEFTLANYVANYFSKTGQDVKIRFVNRLDRDTTGIIVIAKNKFVHHYIQSRMSGDEVKKTYLALTEGEVEESGRIDLPIYRPDQESIERVVDKRGQDSVTNYRLLEKLSKANLVECQLETGRTHQIRVHFKAIGAPLIGDPLYNPESYDNHDLNRQALHAWKLELRTPKGGELSFEAPLPKDMTDFCSRYRRET